MRSVTLPCTKETKIECVRTFKIILVLYLNKQQRAFHISNLQLHSTIYDKYLTYMLIKNKNIEDILEMRIWL